MSKTKFERVETGIPSIAAFRIYGKLGFHENRKVEQLTEECFKRNFDQVIFDFSELKSLGGGVARILRKFERDFQEKGGRVCFVITNEVVLDFLQDEEGSVSVYSSFQEAKGSQIQEDSVEEETGEQKEPGDEGIEEEGIPDEEVNREEKKNEIEETDQVIMMAYDGSREEELGEDEEMVKGAGAGVDEEDETGQAGKELSEESNQIISEIFDEEIDQSEAEPPEWIEKPTSPFKDSGGQEQKDSNKPEDTNKKLRRRVLALKTLFSISSDFNAIKDRRKLIDIFLLTSIAQGGVESAAFMQREDDSFQLVLSKGVNVNRLESIQISADFVGDRSLSPDISDIGDFPLDEEEKNLLKETGFEYISPFRDSGGVAGVVLLGKRIAGRSMKNEDFEFMRTLINIAQEAYENTIMFETEKERTLGIVKTLISLIEENTLLKGSSEFVSRYVGLVAKSMDYPEEHFKDLIYGTVLRDIGMIKISDLILRSPRELTREEWDIIKKHPMDGTEMLRRMKFNKHVLDIVSAHHERFNGEGYPRGLRGKEIPLGARIISVVESYAAMIHERPNRRALSEREALETLRENYGLRYDREVVEKFAGIMEKEIAKAAGAGRSVS